MAATTWVDQVQAWGTIAGIAVAVLGFIAIYITLRETRKQQRTQAGPYVRIDLGVAEESVDDFEPPKVHYADTSNVVDLDEATPSSEKVTISAWLRNYQSHPLGFALGVNLNLFLYASSSRNGDRSQDVTVEIAYLEYGKPVRVDLIKANVPSGPDESIVVSVVEVRYYDFYDQLNVHVFEQEGTNGLHGRLSCVITQDRVSSVPQSWRMGNVIQDR